jgi:hypothetical protein
VSDTANCYEPLAPKWEKAAQEVYKWTRRIKGATASIVDAREYIMRQVATIQKYDKEHERKP